MGWGCHQHELGSSLFAPREACSEPAPQTHAHLLSPRTLWLGLEQPILCKTSLGPAAGHREQPLPLTRAALEQWLCIGEKGLNWR